MDSLNGLLHLAGPLFERTSDPQLRKCWISEHPSICFILCNGSTIGSFRKFIAAFTNKEASTVRPGGSDKRRRHRGVLHLISGAIVRIPLGCRMHWHSLCLLLCAADFSAHIKKADNVGQRRAYAQENNLEDDRVNDLRNTRGVIPIRELLFR